MPLSSSPWRGDGSCGCYQLIFSTYSSLHSLPPPVGHMSDLGLAGLVSWCAELAPSSGSLRILLHFLSPSNLEVPHSMAYGPILP